VPAKGGDALTSGHYLNNMNFFTGFHGKKLKWKEIEEIETRQEV
jgi:hypothetical protein